VDKESIDKRLLGEKKVEVGQKGRISEEFGLFQEFFNRERPHQLLNYKTPAEVYFDIDNQNKETSCCGRQAVLERLFRTINKATFIIKNTRITISLGMESLGSSTTTIIGVLTRELGL